MRATISFTTQPGAFSQELAKANLDQPETLAAAKSAVAEKFREENPDLADSSPIEVALHADPNDIPQDIEAALDYIRGNEFFNSSDNVTDLSSDKALILDPVSGRDPDADITVKGGDTVAVNFDNNMRITHLDFSNPHDGKANFGDLKIPVEYLDREIVDKLTSSLMTA